MELRVDTNLGLAWVDGKKIRLTRTEIILLAWLVDHSDRYWEFKAIARGTGIAESWLRGHIANVRRKTGLTIEYRQSWGYRLIDADSDTRKTD